MAKDGTNRGGARIGSGRKRKSLEERQLEGSLKKKSLSAADKKIKAILKEAQESEEALKRKASGELPEVSDLPGADIPSVSEYLTRVQKDGSTLIAKDIFRQTWLWLKDKGCETLVPKQIVEQYALAVARWIQCEDFISKYGTLGKHPTTGAPMASPFVSMSKDYKRQMNADWFLIWQIVKENGSDGLTAPQDDMMEKLLGGKL